jgi:hypothetical protein
MKYELLVAINKCRCCHSVCVKSSYHLFDKILPHKGVLLHCHSFFFLLYSYRYKDKNDEIFYINSHILSKERNRKKNQLCFSKKKKKIRCEIIEQHIYPIVIDVKWEELSKAKDWLHLEQLLCQQHYYSPIWVFCSTFFLYFYLRDALTFPSSFSFIL